MEYDLEYDVDLMFLDTEPDIRFNELRRFYPKLRYGGYVFIHDAPRGLCQGNINPDHPEYKHWPIGTINREVHEWVLDHDLVPFFFGTPRGFMGLYKRDSRDYNFGRLG
jgi:hypothetical protein